MPKKGTQARTDTRENRVVNRSKLCVIWTGFPITLPRENESVLLGAAILGAVAAKKYSCLKEAMKALNAAGQVCKPISPHSIFQCLSFKQAFKVISFLLGGHEPVGFYLKIKNKNRVCDRNIVKY